MSPLLNALAILLVLHRTDLKQALLCIAMGFVQCSAHELNAFVLKDAQPCLLSLLINTLIWQGTSIWELFLCGVLLPHFGATCAR